MKLFSIHTNLRVVLVCLSIGFGLSACGSGTQYSDADAQFFASENPFAPIINLQGGNPYFHEVKTAFIDPGYSARSLSDGDLSSKVLVQSSVNSNELGEFDVSYFVLSKEGLLAQARRKVVVRDSTPPSLSLNGASEQTLERTNDYIELGYLANDNYDSSLNVSVTGSVDSSKIGTYRLEYQVSDSSGNSSDPKTRLVYVVDTVPPVISITQPAPEFIVNSFNQSAIATSGTCSEQDQDVTVTNTLDSKQVDCVDGEWSTSLNFTGLADGPVSIIAQQLDEANNLSEVSVNGTKDINTPTVSIMNPASDGYFVNAGNQYNFETSGSCSENGSNNVVVSNGVDQKIINCSANHWSTTLNFGSFLEGPVTIQADHSDASGNPAILAIRHGYKDTVAATVTIASPLSGFYVNQANQFSYPTYGSCSETDQPINVTNGVDNQMVNCDAGFWSASLDFSGVIEGSVSIQVSHLDLAGNSPGTDQVNGTLDRTPPSVSISTPANLVVNIASGEQIQTSGMCSENSRQVSVSNGSDSKTPVCTANQWTATLDFSGLNEGPIYIHADLVDEAGNPAVQASLQGLKDVHAPVITINGDNPIQLNLCATYEDLGASAYDNLDGSVSVQTDNPVDELVAANYRVTYSAEDAAGNPAEEVRDVGVLGLDLDGDTYLRGLRTRANVEAIASAPAAHYALCSDIDFNANEDFVPIGPSFQGKFHGQGFKFTNITIHQSSDNEVGVFSDSSSGAVIRNLILDTVIVEGRNSVGSLVGINRGEIHQVRVQNAVISGNDMATAIGGLVGLSETDAEIHEASVVSSSISGEREIGGLVGRNRGEIHDSFSGASVTSTASSNSKVGGLVGKMDRVGRDDPIVFHSYSQGAVEGLDVVGGLIGENSYDDTVIASTWDEETSGIEGPSPDEDRFGIALTTVEMQTESTFDSLGWNLISIWFISIDSYPEHFWYQP
ncbi:MAG: hypothetical protein COV44_08240 [Deltaproteobacteria bacterium CG11_big_fil_rev_8_21_14_0_20_45_16]|nr:MAG: hypothetical protein COV44_08240 [Deltaproteobacteria bacterium CG11_big_fil_rev_8_21_14_0_20_45_16]